MNWPVVGSIANTLVQGIGGWWNYKGMKEANRTNVSLAQQAQQHDIDMYNMTKQTNLDMYNRQLSDTQAQWEKQNAYNSPAAQMQRYADAGLNPNLIYSQGQPGQASSFTAPSISTPSAPKSYVAGVQNAFRDVQFPNIMSILNQYQDWRIKKAQTDNIEASTELMGKKSFTEGFNAQLKKALFGNADYDLGFKESTTNSRYGLLQTSLQSRYQDYLNAQKERDLILSKITGQNLSNQQMRYNLGIWNPEKLRQLKLGNDINALNLGSQQQLAPYNGRYNDPFLARLYMRMISTFDNLFK